MLNAYKALTWMHDFSLANNAPGLFKDAIQQSKKGTIPDRTRPDSGWQKKKKKMNILRRRGQ